MRSSNTAVVAIFAVVGDYTRGGLSFSSVLPATARRRNDSSSSSSSCNCNPRAQHITAAWEQASPASWGGNKARRRRSRCMGALTELHASLPAASAGLPSLDLPGVAAAAVSSPASSSGGGGGRSRRGKYPVIELYRRDVEGSSAAIDHDGGDDSFDEEGLRPRSADGGGPRGAKATAMEHLRSVLRLGSEQSDLMLESFPALADVHPDKLDLHPKLVRPSLGYMGDPWHYCCARSHVDKHSVHMMACVCVFCRVQVSIPVMPDRVVGTAEA